MKDEDLTALTRAEAESYLKRYFGLDHFYDEQWEVIHKIFAGERVLLIERTGFGKSLCYQFPALLFEGLTLIFSPLIALMRDQTQKLNSLNISAAYINSNNTPEENRAIIKKAINGKYKILYIAPERQNNSDWIEAIRQIKFSMVVVDEAHTISTWGHDFRPAFQRIVNLVKILPQHLPVLATTATATLRVQEDIAQQLNGSQPMTILRGSLVRPNLQLQVLTVQSENEKLIWLAEHLPELEGTGLIYVGTTSNTELCTRWLNACGINAVSYNGRYAPDRRIEIENGLMNNQWKCVVSTNALGMGIDKSDIRFIIHMQIPQSPIHYYQEIGRAGRDNKQAQIILMFNATPHSKYEYEDCALPLAFIEGARPASNKYYRIIDLLKQQKFKFSALQEAADIKRTELSTILEDLTNLGIITKNKLEYEYKLKAPQLDLSAFEESKANKKADLEHMVGYVFTHKPRMQYLCEYLDEPNARSKNCDNTNLPRLSYIPNPELETKLQYFYDTLVPELKLAPSYNYDSRVKVRFLTPNYVEVRSSQNNFNPQIFALTPAACTSSIALVNPAQQQFLAKLISEDATLRLTDGYALSYYGGTSFGQIVHRCKYENGGYFPDDLVNAMCHLLAQKYSGVPFDLVLFIPSTISGSLVENFAQRLACALHLPCSNGLVKTRTNKSQKIFQTITNKKKNVQGLFAISPQLIHNKTVLLIDDVCDSGATLKEAGLTIAQAGAQWVVPVTLTKTIGGAQ